MLGKECISHKKKENFAINFSKCSIDTITMQFTVHFKIPSVVLILIFYSFLISSNIYMNEEA